MTKAFKIWWLNRRARHHYRMFRTYRDMEGGLVDYHAKAFNRALDQLQHLNAATPQNRLMVGRGW